MSLIKRLLWWLPAIIIAIAIFNWSATPGLRVVDGPADYILRKTAHYGIYAFLTIGVYLGLAGNAKLAWHSKTAMTAALVAAVYAILDELHQTTVPTRNGNLFDIGVDGLGILTAIAGLAWLKWWRQVTTIPNSTFPSAIISLDQLPKLAADVAATLHGGQVIALYGDLGAGKTTFVQYLAKALGVTKPISSPTFALEKRYQTKDGLTLYHYDWYRLETSQAVAALGIEDVIGQPDAIMIIEWPDRAPDLLPANTITITFDYVNQQTRKITIHR